VSVLSVREVNTGAVEPTSYIRSVWVYVVVPTVNTNEFGTTFSSDRGKAVPASPLKLEVSVSVTCLPSATGMVEEPFDATVAAAVEAK
jgi:hypothetical protein